MQEYLTVAKQAANSFHRKYSFLNKNELQAEASKIMLEAVESYNPTKGRTMKSWIAFLVHRNLKKKFLFQTEKAEMDFNSIPNNNYDPERILLFKETIEGFSQAAQAAVDIIFNEATHEKKEIKRKMREKGFAWNKIQGAFSELKQYANSLS